MAATALLTSSGAPQRLIGVRPSCDQRVVFVFHRARHVGGNDAGPDFIDIDAVLRQARGVKGGDHREGRFADAIIPAIGRGGVGAD